MATEVYQQDDFILEPLSFNDIKWTVSNDDQNGHLPADIDLNGKQVKFLSAALKTFTSKRKREPSINPSTPTGTSPCSKSIHHWRHALMKARSTSDPWDKFHIDSYPTERALRHRYYPLKKEWNVDEVEVKMQPESFARGAMRECFRIKKLSNFSHSRDWCNISNNAVAKRFMEPTDRDIYFKEVKLQMDAKLWGEEYNRHNPPKKVDFFMMAVLEFVDRPDRPLYHVENYIEGQYVKYNSNSGFVLESENHLRATPQAFSHFTFERSGHEIMVVDIQGVGDLYTDPQIHTASGLEYGDGNLGTRGMALFFHSHVCNSICVSLGLAPFDLAKSELAQLNGRNSGSHSPDVLGTISRGKEDICILPSAYQKSHLTEFLRKRSTSTSSLGSPLDPLGEWTSADIAEDESDDDSEVSAEAKDHSPTFSPTSPPSFTSSNGSDSVPRRRQRLFSDAGSATLTEEADRLAFRNMILKKARSSAVTHELEARKKLLDAEEDDDEFQGEDDRRLRTGGSVLGQIHLDLAKYHEMQRFTQPDQEGYDKHAALFHLQHAADCGNLEAIITMARVALQLPHDVLTDLEMEETLENTDMGLDYMHSAAEAGDRAAMIYLAKAYDTGLGLGSRALSWSTAARWYKMAVTAVDGQDEEGNFDGTMDDPPYQLLARLAEMYRDGGHGIERDPTESADLFNQAAESAMSAMKGRLANKYYALAEEVSSAADDE